MMPYKVVRFRIGGKDSGASQYERQIDNALGRESDEYSYIVKDIESYKFLPRFLALILFWLRAQCMLLFGRVDIVIVSPDIMLIYPTYVSIICISHHYDPSVIKGIRLIYVKISNWLFISQSSRVDVVVTCSKYWSSYYEAKGFRVVTTIYCGFDVKAMDHSLVSLDNSLVLNRFNLIRKEYLHLGSFGPGKGQKIAIQALKGLEFPMIATSSAKGVFMNNLQDIQYVNASFNEYNILLKNAKAVICMSEFEEGWCRVLHEAAIHGTPILGSGLGGMNELLEIGGFIPSSVDTLIDDLDFRTSEDSLSREKVESYRTFTLDSFYDGWRCCVGDLMESQVKNV